MSVESGAIPLALLSGGNSAPHYARKSRTACIAQVLYAEGEGQAGRQQHRGHLEVQKLLQKGSISSS